MKDSAADRARDDRGNRSNGSERETVPARGAGPHVRTVFRPPVGSGRVVWAPGGRPNHTGAPIWRVRRSGTRRACDSISCPIQHSLVLGPASGGAAGRRFASTEWLGGVLMINRVGQFSIARASAFLAAESCLLILSSSLSISLTVFIAVSTSVPQSHDATKWTSAVFELTTPLLDPSKILNRCLQYMPFSPAGQVQYALRFLPSLLNVTL